MNDFFVLKKNSWHVKLMKFIWNYDYKDFPNMCPYFWLSVFNCFLVIFGCIPYLIYRIFKPIIKGILNTSSDISVAFEQYCQNRKKNWLDNLINKLLSEDFTVFEELETNKKLNNKLYYDSRLFYIARYTNLTEKDIILSYPEMADKIILLRENFKKWDAQQEKKREIREKFLFEQRTREQTLKEEAIARRKRIGEITVKLKFLFKIIGILTIITIVSLAGWGLFNLFLLLGKLNWLIIGKKLLIGVSILSLIALVIGFAFLLFKSMVFLYCKFGKYCIPCESRRNNLNKFFKWLFINNLVMNSLYNILMYIIKGIKEFFVIIKMLYKNNCPAIEWKD